MPLRVVLFKNTLDFFLNAEEKNVFESLLGIYIPQKNVGLDNRFPNTHTGLQPQNLELTLNVRCGFLSYVSCEVAGTSYADDQTARKQSDRSRQRVDYT